MSNKEPQLPEAIHYLEHHHMVLAMKAKALSMNIGGSHEASLVERTEKELATAIHERDCLSVAIQTLKEARNV